MRRLILPLMLFAFVACQPPEQHATTTGPDAQAIIIVDITHLG